MNLMCKTEKQQMNYLNYNNALWDLYCPSRQYVAESGNVA